MWFFSHAALGYLITIVLVKREERTRTVMMMGAFFGMLPDSDVILQLWSNQVFIAYHRTVSHSITFGLVTAFFCYIILFSSCSRRVFQAFFIAQLSHLLIDAFMDSYYPYGITLLWPLSKSLISFKELDQFIGFGFVTSDSVYFIISVVTMVIAVFLARLFIEREKQINQPKVTAS